MLNFTPNPSANPRHPELDSGSVHTQTNRFRIKFGMTFCTIFSILTAIIPGKFAAAEATNAAAESTAKKDFFSSPHSGQIQDINGFLPEQVYIRTRTQSYCTYGEFALVDGRIYFKEKGESQWKLFKQTGLPHPDPSSTDKFTPPARIEEICADGDSFYAWDGEGTQYYIYLAKDGKRKDRSWLRKFGFPKNTYLSMNDLVKNYRGWSMGARRIEVLWHEDRYGNPHHYGTMGLETVYFLTSDGQHIRFADSGLPQDLSRSVEVPLNGAFIAQNISVSADSIFLIGSRGSMYTRLIDFDTMGCDPMFFQYTYDKVEQKYSGSEYLSNYSPWALPAEDWMEQPKIPLYGQARLTKMISIAQNGHGNAARELRVAGRDQNGNTGFYHKQIFDDEWSFTKANLILDESLFLDPSQEEIGKSDNIEYSGPLIKNGKPLEGFRCFLSGASLCSEDECSLNIAYKGERWKCKLFAVEKWTYMQRYDPGRDESLRDYFITPEFDQKEFDSYSPEFSSILKKLFGERNHKLFVFSAKASLEYFQITINGSEGASFLSKISPLEQQQDTYVIFLTKRGIFQRNTITLRTATLFPRKNWEKYFQPELTLQNGKSYSIKERTQVQNVIDLNKKCVDELKKEINESKKTSSSAGTSRWGYSIIDLITRITFLNRLNFPKIKQVTSFGNQIMTSNAENFAQLASYKELIYSNILDLVERRIQNYSKIIEDFDANKISSTLNSDAKDSYVDYFDTIFLPHYAEEKDKDGGVMASVQIATETPFVPAYVFFSTDGSMIIVLLKDSIGTITSLEKLPSSAEEAKKIFAEKPVKFQVELLLTNFSGTEKDRSVLSNKKSPECFYDTGTLEWNGKKLTIKARTALYSYKEIFCGK